MRRTTAHDVNLVRNSEEESYEELANHYNFSVSWIDWIKTLDEEWTNEDIANVVDRIGRLADSLKVVRGLFGDG